MIAGLMVQREATATLMMDEIAAGRLAKDIVGPNQIRQLAASKSPSISKAAGQIWGSIRLEESAGRQRVVREMTEFLLKDAHGDAQRGLAVFDRVCGQCHVMHNRGYEVGPNITRNGRGSFEQLIISVFDPSLVIGEAYRSVTVLTVDGRVISGLVTERSEQRIALKVQGGKVEVIPMDDVEEIQDNAQSLMPEGLEEQINRKELADLFALLSLENPPDAAENSPIAGTPEGLHSKR
jgi:putative heme-binding domain-containing protein